MMRGYMGNRIKLFISAEEIYNNLLPEQKERFKDIEIVSAIVRPSYCAHPNSSGVDIECLALENEVTEYDYIQCMSFKEGEYIVADYDELNES